MLLSVADSAVNEGSPSEAGWVKERVKLDRLCVDAWGGEGHNEIHNILTQLAGRMIVYMRLCKRKTPLKIR